MATALERVPGVTIARRCADVAELLSVAEAGVGQVAVVSFDLRALELDVVARLRSKGMRVIGLHPADDEPAQRRLRQLAVPTLLPLDATTIRPDARPSTPRLLRASRSRTSTDIDEPRASEASTASTASTGCSRTSIATSRQSAKAAPRLPILASTTRARRGRLRLAAVGLRTRAPRPSAARVRFPRSRPRGPRARTWWSQSGARRAHRVGRRSRRHWRPRSPPAAATCCSSTPTPTAAVSRRPSGCSTRLPASRRPAGPRSRAPSTCLPSPPWHLRRCPDCGC